MGTKMENKRPTFNSIGQKKNEEFHLPPSNKQNETAWSSVLMGIGVIVIVSSMTFIGTIMLSSNTQATKSDYFANEITPVARDYATGALNSSASFGAIAGVIMKYKVNKTDTGLDAIDSELHEQCLKPLSPKVANDVMRLGYIGLSPAAGSNFLKCTMQIQKSRFCDSYYRKRLAKRLSGTLKKQQLIVARYNRIKNSGGMQGYALRQAKKYNKMIKDTGNRGINTGRTPIKIINAGVGAKITELSKHGLLNKSDFGLSILSTIPPEIERYMVEQEREVCPSSWF
jgi:hypothetical protein